MAENKTGLPDNLRNGIEQLSGMDMSDVKVHYNSARPAQLNAHAYSEGREIHLAPGQQHHLAHEAWHIVQQAQGRVSSSGRTHIGLASDEDALRVERDLLARRTPV